jgi:lipopolysaccharide transport system permease protein
MNSAISAVWSYRGFVVGSVKREFQLKYRNSMLGAVWNVITPLSMIFVYIVIFSQLMRSRLPDADPTFGYSIYLTTGVLTWGLFVEIASRAQNIFIEQANLIKKLSFPRLTLPLIVVLSASLNFAIIFSLFILFLIFSGNWPGWVALAFVPIILVQIAFAIGLGVTLGVLHVFFRDVGQAFAVVLNFWFWFTPIVYPPTILPEQVRAILLGWNPMAPLVGAAHGIFVSGQMPEWSTLLMPTVLAILLCWLGLRLFRKRAGEMVDEL